MNLSAMAPAGGDQSRASELLIVTWIECDASMIFIVLRFYTRTKVTGNLWYDDWAIFFNTGKSPNGEMFSRSTFGGG